MAGIVILGAGHAGVQLAASLRDSGFEGSVTLVSDETDLPYHKPPLSKSFMKAQDAELQPLRGEAFFEEAGITRAFGHAVASVDAAAKTVTLENGEALPFEKLVFATGTRARVLPVDGAGQQGVYYLRTAEDARALRRALPSAKSVAIVGGGFIGLEAAMMLRGLGLEATVIEAAPRLLGRAVSEELAQFVEHYLQDQGVEVILGAGVDAVTGDGVATGVRLQDGRDIAADLVIVGIGAEPVDELARAAGASVGNGIEVDALMETSLPDVYAIGDCVCFPQAQTGQDMRLESVQNATDQARALAATLTGTPKPYDALPWFWSDIGGLKLQIAGLSVDADESVTIRFDGAEKLSVYRFAGDRLVTVETINSPAEHMLARRMITDGFTPDRAKLTPDGVAALKADYMGWVKAGKP